MPTLTRQQIARIVGNDPVAIQAFEAILTGITVDLPTSADAAEIGSAVAEAKAAEAVDAIKDLAQALATLPVNAHGGASDPIEPPAHVGTAETSIADLAPPLFGGASGTFTTSDPFTVTVVDGRIVSIA